MLLLGNILTRQLRRYFCSCAVYVTVT